MKLSSFPSSIWRSAALWFCLAAGFKPGLEAAPTITLYPHLTPSHGNGPKPMDTFESAQFDRYVSNALNGLGIGQPNFGGKQEFDPAAFNTLREPIINNSVNMMIGPLDAISTSFFSWRGNLKPAGAFSGEFGTTFRVGVTITDPVPFTLEDVVANVDYPPFFRMSATTTLGPIFQFFPGQVRAVYWGADGKERTADDVSYDTFHPAAADTPINKLIFVGLPELVTVCAKPGNTEREALERWMDYVDSNPGLLYISHGYLLRDVVATVNAFVETKAVH